LTLVLQARYSILVCDEAYYWLFSEDLAWGDFDHPPVTALLIKAGYFFFRNVSISVNVQEPIFEQPGASSVIKVRFDYRNYNVRDFEANEEFP